MVTADAIYRRNGNAHVTSYLFIFQVLVDG